MFLYHNFRQPSQPATRKFQSSTNHHAGPTEPDTSCRGQSPAEMRLEGETGPVYQMVQGQKAYWTVHGGPENKDHLNRNAGDFWYVLFSLMFQLDLFLIWKLL